RLPRQHRHHPGTDAATGGPTEVAVAGDPEASPRPRGITLRQLQRRPSRDVLAMIAFGRIVSLAVEESGADGDTIPMPRPLGADAEIRGHQVTVAIHCNGTLHPVIPDPFDG